MKLNLKKLLQDKFIRGTFFLTAAGFGGAFLNYLVHPILTRHLSIPAYGDFQALLSFVTILGILTAAINTVITKETALLAAKHPEEIEALRKKASRRFFLFGLFIFTLVVIFIRPLNALFKISEGKILIIASLNLLYVFPLVINRAVLRGQQDFFALALNTFFDAFSRLFFILLFVVLWSAGLNGAAWAVGLTGVLAFFISFYQIKRLKLPVAPTGFQVSWRRLWRYSFLVLWFMTLTQFFYNFDMLFVKSFFRPEEAGLYGALLTIGRIIYFIGGVVPAVMFPVIANLKEDDSLRRYFVLGKSLLLLVAITLPAYLLISWQPEFIIKVIVGSKYLSLAPYLGSFSLVMIFLTLINILANYFLALASRWSLVILSLTAILEIVFLSLGHHNFKEVIFSLNLAFGTGAGGLLLLAILEYKKTKQCLYVQENKC
ncbi:MAG: oligosaccharide flippase family protein [Patescibacteria group bacterium]|jgi:O-antigen/teichoic acid export membrane protein